MASGEGELVRTKRRIGATLAVVALVLAACDEGDGGEGDGATPTPAAGGTGTLIHGTTDTIVSLDPAGSYDLGSWQIIYQIMNGLLEVEAGGSQPVPALAESCDYEDDTTYTCTLREGLTFSDGTELTSEDVATSFERNILIDDPNGACSLLFAIADCGKWKGNEIETPDPQTVTFNLRQPDATWPFVLTTGAAFIVPSEYPMDELQDDAAAVGSGRYAIAEYRPGEQLVLERNDGFWGDPAANERVIVQYFDRSSALKLAVEQGEVHVGWRTFTPTELADLEGAEGLEVLEGEGAEIRYIAFNLSHEPFDQLPVRQAIAMTIDRQAIVDNVYEGTVEPLYTMVPSGLEGSVPVFADRYGEDPDVEGAAQLLEDAGIDTPLDLEIWWTPTHYGDASADEYAEIERTLEDSGLFNVTLKSTEWDQYSEAATTDQYPAFQLGWFPDYTDADNYVSTFYSSSSYLNIHYENKKVDDLLAQERASTDPDERIEAFEQIQEIGAEEVPVLPIWEGQQIAVVRDGVVGVEETLDPSYQFRYWMIGVSE
jgi:peptide/nickel transport system substrate-binding protein